MAWVDQRVQTVDDELRAPEAHELLAEDDDALEGRRSGDKRAKQHVLSIACCYMDREDVRRVGVRA